MRLPGRVVALAAVLSAACAASARSTSRPSATAVDAWTDAVSRDDARAAYELLSAAVRKDVPFEVFAQRWKESQSERKRQAAALAGAIRDNPRLGESGKLQLGDRKTVVLTHERGGWRLDEPLLAASHAATPQDALRHLASALDARSFDAAMKLLTARRRDGVRVQVDQLSNGIRKHVGDNIEVSGNRATIQWTDGKQRWRVVMIREEGEWRIDDLTVR